MSTEDALVTIFLLIVAFFIGWVCGYVFGYDADWGQKHRESHGDKDDKPNNT